MIVIRIVHEQKHTETGIQKKITDFYRFDNQVTREEETLFGNVEAMFTSVFYINAADFFNKTSHEPR